MSTPIIQDDQVRDHFLTASSQALCGYIDHLQAALNRYSLNPKVIPPRYVGTTPDGTTTHLFMPVLDDKFSGLKTLGYNPSSDLGFVGAVTVTEPQSGALIGVVQAKQLTAVRTAMASCIGIRRDFSAFGSEVHITVFGTGLQAFWHLYICAKLLEDRKVTTTVVYRSSPMDIDLLKSHLPSLEVTQVQLKKTAEVRETVSQSDIVFGCVPSSEPAILEEYLSSGCGPKYTYISLIGSYKPHMHECNTALVKLFQEKKVQILVDSREHTLLESGELIDASAESVQLLELGELNSDVPVPKANCQPDRLVTLCKIVGLAIMDVSMAHALLVELGP